MECIRPAVPTDISKSLWSRYGAPYAVAGIQHIEQMLHAEQYLFRNNRIKIDFFRLNNRKVDIFHPIYTALNEQ